MGTRTVEATVAESVALAPGMFARLTITVKEVADSIVVPASAAVTTPSGTRMAYVFQDGKVSQRKLETGIEEGGRVQIVNGLKAGEQVVLGGQSRLKDGMAVVLMAESPLENVGQASSLTVHGASVPRHSGGRMPPEPADKMSAPHLQTGSEAKPDQNAPAKGRGRKP